jgi:hypothetical protein
MKFPDKPERNKTDVWYGAGVAVGTMIILPIWIFIMALIKAFVVSQLWHWYIVPFFHQPDLPLAIGFGIGLLISYLVPNRDFNKDNTWSNQLLFAFIFPAFTLLFGWIGTFFI